VSLVAHHVLLGLAVAALLGTGFRLASLATPTGLERGLAAVVYAAALAVIEAIALGRFGIGAKSLPLGVVAGLTWVTTVLIVPAPEVSATAELRGAWRRTGTWARVGVGVTGGVGLAFAVWLLRHPSIGLDSNLYHYVEVSRWLHDGGIGGFERLDYGVSYSSYPLTNQVLLAWGAGIGRSFAPLALWMPFTLALAGAATWRGLRNLEVGLVPTLLAVAALITLPLVVRELNEPSNDLPALAWLACTGALCAAAPRRPRLLAPAVVAAGLALGSKTSTLVPLVACLGVVLWMLRGRLRELLAPLGAAAVAALAIGGLWFVRDIVLYGSPFWPHVSAPGGEPKPRFFQLVGERFIARPAATLHGRVDVYLARMGGGLLLVVAGLLAPLAGSRLAGVPVAPAQRRALFGAAAVLALAVLAWAAAPVTGLPRTGGLDRPGFLAESGLRYALPALLTAIVAVALAARSGGRAATAATAVLAAAVAWNLIELAQLGPPFTPSLLVVAAGAAFGLAVLGAATVLARALRPAGRRREVSGAVVGAAIAAVAGGLLAIGATGYVERSSRLAESTSLGRGVVSWFVSRPNFANGHRPIAFATRAPIAALAGDHFNHVLTVVPPFESCARVRARASAGWVVVTDPSYGYGFLSVDPYTTPRCFRNRAPVYDDGTFRVYSSR
jgi:hypothetical protein